MNESKLEIKFKLEEDEIFVKNILKYDCLNIKNSFCNLNYQKDYHLKKRKFRLKEKHPKWEF